MISIRSRSYVASLLLVLLLAAAPAAGQEPAAAPAPAPVPDPHAGMAMPAQEPQDPHAAHVMPMPGGLQTPAIGLFPLREASGTAWVPDASPMYGTHHQVRGWEVMLMGNSFVQYLQEFAPEHRGAHQTGSINWLMAMARRPLGAGRIGLRTMFSLEPWTIAGCGYPDLLATGELCDGDNIHDRQHPHDLVMEAAIDYRRPITPTVSLQLYGGPAGEPALGPAAFPHRLSAMPNPIAPMTHHWLDATHITYGVATVGVFGAKWKAEGSAFNGREPDERRTDFDLAALDSLSARLWWLPSAAFALQVSAGHLNDAERAFGGAPAVDVKRVTASVTYHRRSAESASWATTLAWGSNLELGERTHGALVETAFSRNQNGWFGRVEVNGKPAHDLHIHNQSGVLTVSKVQVGYTRSLALWRGLQPGFGGYLSAGFVPASIRPQYGGVGTGIGLFLTLRPGAHEM